MASTWSKFLVSSYNKDGELEYNERFGRVEYVNTECFISFKETDTVHISEMMIDGNLEYYFSMDR